MTISGRADSDGFEPGFRNVTLDNIRSYYTESADDYRTMWLNPRNLAMHFGFQENNAISHSASLLNANRIIADIAQIGAEDRVLDAGCGLAGSSLWLARERQARVIGIALGADQVDAARREARRRKLSNKAQFLVADFTVLPFQAGSFDAVWAQESLCHADDKAAFLAEAARVLAPNGRLVVADFMLKSTRHGAADRKLLEEWFAGWNLPGLWTAGQHANGAGVAGLSDICIVDVTHRTLPSHRRLYQLTQRTRPFFELLRLIGFRNHIQTANFVAAVRQYQALKNDCWFYGILSARRP